MFLWASRWSNRYRSLSLRTPSGQLKCGKQQQERLWNQPCIILCVHVHYKVRTSSGNPTLKGQNYNVLHLLWSSNISNMCPLSLTHTEMHQCLWSSSEGVKVRRNTCVSLSDLLMTRYCHHFTRNFISISGFAFLFTGYHESDCIQLYLLLNK